MMGGGRKKGKGESAEARDTQGVQEVKDSEFTQFMKWMMERDERRRNEDRIRDETILKMVEAISKKQSETTEEMRSTEQLREEARWEELRIARERQQLEHDVWRERMEKEREDREMWRKYFEEDQVQKASTTGSHGLENSGMMRQMGQPKLQRLSDSDDVEHFLTTFERLVQAYKWPLDMWVLNLALLLTGKAQSAYASMDMEKAREYLSVKEAILKRYDIQLIKHKVDVSHAMPIRQRPYRLPWVHRDAVRKELDMMLEHGIIEESSSEWAQPLVIVPKKGSSEVRLCIDFRRVNQVAKMDSYPLPRIEDLIDKMAKAKCISTMDLSRSYWQIPLTDGSKDKTAFITPFGLWHFVTMPFGLADAQATCQRLVDTRLIRGIEDHAAAYVDDLTVFSMTWEDHLVHLQDMLERLQNAGLTVKPKKCRFGMEETEYLGHVVGNGMVKPCQSKTEAVKQFPVPETKKQVRSCLGLAGYYRKFIKNFSDVAAPLTNLTKKRETQKVKWTQECDQAFQQLKDVLCQKPVFESARFYERIQAANRRQ